MKAPGLLVLFLVVAVSARAGGGSDFFHPRELLAGAWQVPIFYVPTEEPAGPPSIRATAGTETVRLLLDPLERLGGGPRYGLFLSEPPLTVSPGEPITLDVVVGDRVVREGVVRVEARLDGGRLLSIGEEGRGVVWDGDGTGTFEPWDTVAAAARIEEGLAFTGTGGEVAVVAVTAAGDLIEWGGVVGLRERKRVPLGGRATCAAPGSRAGEGFVGLLDGRVIRFFAGAIEKSEVVAVTGGIPTSLAVGDADGDGTADLVATVIEMERSLLLCWGGIGGGRYAKDDPRVIPLAGTGRSVLFGALDPVEGERLLLLVDGASVGLSDVTVWSLADRDSVRSVALPGIGSKSVHRLITGDWNGDGATDLAVLAGVRDARVEFFVSDRSGRGCRPMSAVPVGGPEVDLVAGDFDRNGADDLIAAEGEFRIWLSDGSGRMVRRPNPPAGRPARLVPVGPM